jgi:hypothetical protein
MSVRLIPHKPDRIIGLDINGSISAEDIERVVEVIEKKFDTTSKLRIYAEISNWSGMSLGAFVKDLNFSLKHLNDFEKEAIVSDSKWLEALAALGNSLFSGIEVKHFNFKERDKALEWISS